MYAMKYALVVKYASLKNNKSTLGRVTPIGRPRSVYKRHDECRFFEWPNELEGQGKKPPFHISPTQTFSGRRDKKQCRLILRAPGCDKATCAWNKIPAPDHITVTS